MGNQWVGNHDEATSELTIKLTCDGVPMKDHEIGLRIDPQPYSGWHDHVKTRPRGKLTVGLNVSDCGQDTQQPDNKDCKTVRTDDNGEAKVKFEVPLTGAIDNASYGSYQSGVAGFYKITAKSRHITASGQLAEISADTTVRASVDKLTRIEPDASLKVVRGGTAAHEEGSYATAGVKSAFASLAGDFANYQRLHNLALTRCGKPEWPVAPLSTNDIALPDGGIFDWNIGKTPWRPSHQTHNKGEGGDFNRFGAADSAIWKNTGTECDGSTVILVEWYVQVLLDLAKKYGKWDCFDLGASGKNPLFSPKACAVGEIPEVGAVLSAPGAGAQGPIQIFFPPDLHLHVFASLGGDG